MEEFTKIIKNLFREKINIVITLLVILFALNFYEFIFNNINYTKIRKKIDHRYFNTTKTLEDIYNIEINTYNGELKRIRD